MSTGFVLTDCLMTVALLINSNLSGNLNWFNLHLQLLFMPNNSTISIYFLSFDQFSHFNNKPKKKTTFAVSFLVSQNTDLN